MSSFTNSAIAGAASTRLVAALAASLGLHVGAVTAVADYLVVASEAPTGSSRAGLTVSLREPSVQSQGKTVPAMPQAHAQSETQPAVPGVHYYATRELDVRPGIMTRVDPEYPERAARRFLAGKVIVRLFIDEAGKVERVAILQAEPPGYFEQPAQDAFKAARFSPGMKGGRPVKTQMTLEVNFEHPRAPGS